MDAAREFTAKITRAARAAVWETDSYGEYRRTVWAAMQTIRTRQPMRFAVKREITKSVIDRIWREDDSETLEPGQAAFLRSLKDEGTV